ncbi:DUF4232 domain-containing protein [Streptomyces mobaraensis]|uniref:DUF4232 domain-containing protein n=1 Tax=Streptomyces mobaraensis TaxID=35621 RepID=A0A5N5VZT7_STRMB|nr:DUF4232 domain-containing protein [Streptomyces mobaraensis]
MTARETRGNTQGKEQLVTRLTATRLVSVAAAAGIALAAASGTAGAAQGGPDTASGTPTCGTSDLRISFAERLGGGMNHAGGTLELKNTTQRTCALRGYPGLGLADSQRKALPSHTVWGSTWYADDPGNKLIYLKPGEAAQANVAWTHSGTAARKGTYLLVTPPAARTHQAVPLDDLVDNGELHVTAVAHKVPVRG